MQAPGQTSKRQTNLALFLAALLLFCSQTLFGQAPPPLAARDLAMTIPGDFVVASVGDLMMRRPASQLQDDDIQAALQLIRDADLAVGNMEGELGDWRTFEGPANGFLGSPAVAADLKAIGFDMVNRAQNHLLDSEAAGMFSTNALLDEAGIVHAGTGRNLDEAAAPAYLELPQGRVGIVGMHAPLFHEMRRLAATPRVGNLGGRPGLNMLHYRETIVVSEDQFAALKQVRDQFDEYRSNYDNPRPSPNEPTDQLSFPASSSGREDPTYRVARPGEVPGTIDYTIDSADLQRTLRSIRNAKRFSDYVVATAHIHQGQSVLERMHLSTKPPRFYVELAHQAIDVGADVFVGHGVQLLRGVEIYKGKPIFYGLGEFFREAQWTLEEQLAQVDADQDGFWPSNFVRNFGGSSQSLESLVATSHYRDGELVEVRLYPTELGSDGPDSRLGIPRLAESAIAQRILQRMQRLSSELGTEIEIQGDVGVIRIN